MKRDLVQLSKFNFDLLIIGGDILRIYGAGKYLLLTYLAAASVFVDRFTGLLTVLFAVIVTWIVVAIQTSEVRWLLAGGVLALASAMTLWWIAWTTVERFWRNRPEGPIGKTTAALASGHAAVRGYRNHVGCLATAIALSFVFLFLSGLNYWSGALAFQSGVETRTIFLIVPIILLFGGLRFFIGGWALQEPSASVVFNSAGFEAALGLSTAILIRAKNVALAVMSGILYLLPWRPQPFQNCRVVKSERVTFRHCENAAEWDEFVSCVPWSTPQHAFVWGQALASCFSHVRPVYRLFYSYGSVVAGLPLIRFSAGWPFRALYSLVFDSYGGPLIHPEHLDDSELLLKISAEIDSEAAQYGAFEARFSVPPTTPDAVIRCLQLGGGVVSFRRSCPLLALDRPLEQIVQGYQSSVRRNVRRSAREGVIVEENVDIVRVRQAYPIYRETMDRIGGTAKPWRFIEALLRKKLAVPFVAQRDSRPIGLVILLVSSRMAIYWISAAELSASTFRPTNAMVNHAIRWCHVRGIPIFNLGESYRERPGLVRFKKEWGPATTEGTVIIRIYRPWIQRTWHTLEPMARRIYAAWDQWRTSIS